MRVSKMMNETDVTKNGIRQAVLYWENTPQGC